MPASFRLDHIVIRVYDLPKAIKDYNALGFKVVPGGEHPRFGSRNALIAFEDDTYLELWTLGSGPPARMVPREARFRELAGRSPVEQHWLPWESSPEGLVDFALAPSDIREAIDGAQNRGLHLDGPVPGERLRPDGQRVAWELAFADGVDLPFLCADVTPRSLRVPGGEARRHSNGIIGVDQVVVAVTDRKASIARYSALLAQEPRADAEFPLGSTRLLLVSGDDNGPSQVDFRYKDGASATGFRLRRKHPCMS